MLTVRHLDGGPVSDQGVRTKINPKDGAVMVFIPTGKFLMGDDAIKDNPRHAVTLSGYWMYRDLVTAGMYKKFCEETHREMPPDPPFNPNWSKADHPVVNVTWDDAVAYCTWAGVRLPTEAQWEKAARGVDSRLFPWGNTFDLSKLWASKSAVGDSGGTHRVGDLGISPYGCTDMAGNVWQWCMDWYDADFWGSPGSKRANPVNLSAGKKLLRVMRGGSWYDYVGYYFRASYRIGYAPGSRDSGAVGDGFRGVAVGH